MGKCITRIHEDYEALNKPSNQLDKHEDTYTRQSIFSSYDYINHNDHLVCAMLSLLDIKRMSQVSEAYLHVIWHISLPQIKINKLNYPHGILYRPLTVNSFLRDI